MCLCLPCRIWCPLSPLSSLCQVSSALSPWAQWEWRTMGYPSSTSHLYSLSSLPLSGPSDRRTQAATDCAQQQPLLETGGHYSEALRCSSHSPGWGGGYSVEEEGKRGRGEGGRNWEEVWQRKRSKVLGAPQVNFRSLSLCCFSSPNHSAQARSIFPKSSSNQSLPLLQTLEKRLVGHCKQSKFSAWNWLSRVCLIHFLTSYP